MRRAGWVFVLSVVSGCASGRPIRELLPDEVHVRQVAAALPGDYRPGLAPDGITAPAHLSWVPVGEDEREEVGYELDSTWPVQPASFVERTGTFEVGAQLTAAQDLPAIERVSMALHALEPVDEPGPPDAERALRRLMAGGGRLPPRVASALQRPPVGVVEDVRPAEDGRTYGATWSRDGATAPWRKTWYGYSADYVVSVVVIDVDGGVARALVVASALASDDADAGEDPGRGR